MRSYLLRNTDLFLSFIDRWSRGLAVVAIILAVIVIILPAFLTCSRTQSIVLKQRTEQEKSDGKYYYQERQAPQMDVGRPNKITGRNYESISTW